jgi:hypothetical protein
MSEEIGANVEEATVRFLPHAAIGHVAQVRRSRHSAAVPGHKDIQHTVRYTDMAPDRSKNFWRD